MQKLFVSYTLALILKDKGFNESCLGHYSTADYPAPIGTLKSPISYLRNSDYQGLNYVTAPMFQQVIDWFILTHNIHICFGSNHSGWYWNITKTNGTTIKDQSDSCYFKTHHEALIKSIEEALELI